jgi:hypothetical protein
MKKESCLKHIYPAIYDDEYERLRLLERVADLFRFCLGVRGSLRMGPTPQVKLIVGLSHCQVKP